MNINSVLLRDHIKLCHNIARSEEEVVERVAEAFAAGFERRLSGSLLRLSGLRQVIRDAVGDATSAFVGPLERIAFAALRCASAPIEKLAALLRRGREQERGQRTMQILAVFAPPSESQARAIVARLMRSDSWAAAVSLLVKNQEARAGAILADALAAGVTPTEIADRLIDRLGAERNWGRWVRTEIQRVSNSAQQEAYEAQRDLLAGQEYVATLDHRACPVCYPMDGKVFWYSPRSGEASVQDAPQVPRHAQCRCTYAPVVKSLDELGIPRDAVPASVARAWDGQLADRLTYGEWLAGLDWDDLEAALGAQGAALFAAGATPERIAAFSLEGLRLAPEDIPAEAGKLAQAAEVRVQRVDGSARDVAREHAEAGRLAETARSLTPLVQGAALEVSMVGLVKEAVDRELSTISRVARRAQGVRVQSVAKTRYVFLPDGVIEQRVNAVRVTGLTEEQMRAIGERLVERLPTPAPDIRIRGAQMPAAWKSAKLRVLKTDTGYVELLGDSGASVAIPPPMRAVLSSTKRTLDGAQQNAILRHIRPPASGAVPVVQRGRAVLWETPQGAQFWRLLP